MLQQVRNKCTEPKILLLMANPTAVHLVKKLHCVHQFNLCYSQKLRLTLTWPMCQIWHIYFLQILNAPADCMVKQTLE